VIERMMETSDGSTVVTQFGLTETHTGTYKSVPATGVRVTFSACNILTFDAQGKIVAEEAYYDDLQTMLQLGAVRRVGND
jgi:predicted ester cyclase